VLQHPLKNNQYHKFFLWSVLILVSFFSLFIGSLNGEIWGYWLFADLLREEYEFVISGRSPLYTVYLQTFNWLSFPVRFYLEYFFTSLVLIYSLYTLVKTKIDALPALLLVIIWFPVIRSMDPPVQSLALSFTCLAFALRMSLDKKNTTLAIKKYFLFYTLLLCAVYLRSSYILMFVVTLFSDLYLNRNTIIKNRYLIFQEFFKLRNFHFLMLVIFGLISSNLTLEHKWNNAWFTSTEWYPINPGDKSLANPAFIQSMYWKYIENHLDGSFDENDQYLTNKVLFNNKNTIMDALKENPEFVFNQWEENFFDFLRNVSSMNAISKIVTTYSKYVIPIVVSFFIVVILFRYLRDQKDLIIFMFSSMLVAGSSIIAMVKFRYMIPLMPFFIFFNYYIYSYLNKSLDKFLTSKKSVIIYSGILFILFSVFVLLLSLKGYIDIYFLGISIDEKFKEYYFWAEKLILIIFFVLLANFLYVTISKKFSLFNKFKSQIVFLLVTLSFTPIVSDMSIKINSITGKFDLLNLDTIPVIRDKDKVSKAAKNCKGILTNDHILMSILLEQKVEIYDFEEIPPFGEYKNSLYKGLHEDRIDCVFYSHTLLNQRGSNKIIRYKNFIEPYINHLTNNGWKKLDLVGHQLIYREENER